MPCPTSNCCRLPSWVVLYTRLILTVVGFVAGLVAFFILFLKPYYNYNAAVWAFLSSIFATTGLHLTVLQLRNRLHRWYDTSALTAIEGFGIFNACASVVATGVYLSLAITKDQDFTIGGSSYYIAAVFSLATFIWAALLGYISFRSGTVVEFLSLA